MGKRYEYTTNTQIKNKIRQLFLQSRERTKCLKSGKCAECEVEGVKFEVHHPRGINWNNVISVIREEVLTDDLVLLCKDCHRRK